jgi:antitoxin ParD1/3/4
MNISLTKQLTEFVRKKVKSGRYGSASEVVRDALRLMERHDEAYAAKLERLRADVQAGLKQLDAGQTVSAEEAFRNALGDERGAA